MTNAMMMQERVATFATAANACLAMSMWLAMFGRTTLFGESVEFGHLAIALLLSVTAALLDRRRWRFHLSIGVLVISSLTLSMHA